jgi:hypothetical protein
VRCQLSSETLKELYIQYLYSYKSEVYLQLSNAECTECGVVLGNEFETQVHFTSLHFTSKMLPLQISIIITADATTTDPNRSEFARNMSLVEHTCL